MRKLHEFASLNGFDGNIQQRHRAMDIKMVKVESIVQSKRFAKRTDVRSHFQKQ